MICKADLLHAMSFNALNQEDASRRRHYNASGGCREMQAASDEAAAKKTSPARKGGVRQQAGDGAIRLRFCFTETAR
jgi:hypothetical protein